MPAEALLSSILRILSLCSFESLSLPTQRNYVSSLMRASENKRLCESEVEKRRQRQVHGCIFLYVCIYALCIHPMPWHHSIRSALWRQIVVLVFTATRSTRNNIWIFVLSKVSLEMLMPFCQIWPVDHHRRRCSRMRRYLCTNNKKWWSTDL